MLLRDKVASTTAAERSGSCTDRKRTEKRKGEIVAAAASRSDTVAEREVALALLDEVKARKNSTPQQNSSANASLSEPVQPWAVSRSPRTSYRFP